MKNLCIVLAIVFSTFALAGGVDSNTTMPVKKVSKKTAAPVIEESDPVDELVDDFFDRKDNAGTRQAIRSTVLRGAKAEGISEEEALRRFNESAERRLLDEELSRREVNSGVRPERTKPRDTSVEVHIDNRPSKEVVVVREQPREVVYVETPVPVCAPKSRVTFELNVGVGYRPPCSDVGVYREDYHRNVWEQAAYNEACRVRNTINVEIARQNAYNRQVWANPGFYNRPPCGGSININLGGHHRRHR